MLRHTPRTGTCLAILLGLVLLQTPAHAQSNRKQIYAQTLRCCAAVLTAGGPAAGWVCDVDKKQVVTNYHVIGGREYVEVLFPQFNGKKLITEREHYLTLGKRYKGKVIHTDARRDLALVQLDALPAGVAALRLAPDSAEPGEELHLIGNPSASYAMWLYTSGTLRQVYKKKFSYKDTSHEVHAFVGETQLPANPGDSGGPVVNDRGELVGVHSGGTPEGVQLLAIYIDVSEVRAFLREPAKVVKLATAKEYHDRGHTHFHAGQYDLAIADYSEAIRLDPKLAPAYRDRASAYLRRGMYDKAIADCDACLRLDPKHALAYNDRAVAYGYKKQYDRCIADYTEAINLDPKNALYHANRAWAYVQTKDWDRVIVDATNSLKLDPRQPLTLNDRGIAFDNKGEHARAIDDFTESLRLNPRDPVVFVNRGQAYSRRKEYDKAIADYTQAIQLSPAYAQAFRDRGVAHSNKGDYRLAVNDYSEAIRYNPRDAHAYLYRSFAYTALGDSTRADSDRKMAQKIDPNIGRMP